MRKPTRQPFYLAAVFVLAFCGLGVASPSQAVAFELVMLETRYCGACRQFNREAGPEYNAHPAAKTLPLRRIDLDTGTIDVTLNEPVTMTPTFVFVDEGREIGRFYGYPGKTEFFKLVNGIVEELRKVAASRAEH